jgi:hypothetical protein
MVTRPHTAVAFAVALATLAVAAPVPKGLRKTPPHPTAVGTRWEYVHRGNHKEVGVIEITHAEEKDGATTIRTRMTLFTGVTLTERFTLSGGSLWQNGRDDTTYDPPVLKWKAGAKEGDSWQVAYTDGTTAFEATYTVGREEQIATPAGAYTAVPVRDHYLLPDTNLSDTVHWYAVGVGMVRMATPGEEHPAWDLKAFTPK